MLIPVLFTVVVPGLLVVGVVIGVRLLPPGLLLVVLLLLVGLVIPCVGLLVVLLLLVGLVLPVLLWEGLAVVVLLPVCAEFIECFVEHDRVSHIGHELGGQWHQRVVGKVPGFTQVGIQKQAALSVCTILFKPSEEGAYSAVVSVIDGLFDKLINRPALLWAVVNGLTPELGQLLDCSVEVDMLGYFPYVVTIEGYQLCRSSKPGVSSVLIWSDTKEETRILLVPAPPGLINDSDGVSVGITNCSSY